MRHARLLPALAALTAFGALATLPARPSGGAPEPAAQRSAATGTLALAAPLGTAMAPALAPADAPPPLPRPPNVAEAARLATGEVLLASRPVGPRSLAEEMGTGLVNAAPERVFAAVADFAHYQEWVPFVKGSDAQPQADGSVVSFQSLELPFPLGKRYYKIRARGGPQGEGEARVWRVWWRYVPGTGNVADHHGWWVLVRFGAGRTLGTCLLYTDPGGHLPAWTVHRGLAETMPYVFSGLRQQILRSRYDRPALP